MRVEELVPLGSFFFSSRDFQSGGCSVKERGEMWGQGSAHDNDVSLAVMEYGGIECLLWEQVGFGAGV